ncbi:MAG TPA: hypothetical protein VL147_22365, partial [Devosia sp.]|nr:hypothetical protein [Devosia sp.]
RRNIVVGGENMADIREKFSNYKASKKTLFWSCAGAAVLTMVIGFTWGGCVTGGSAADRAETASTAAVAALAADVCFNRFMAASDVQASMTAFQAESSYSRAKYIADGGWTTLGGQDKPIDGAAKLCAEKLADAEIPATTAVAPVAETAPVAVGASETVVN